MFGGEIVAGSLVNRRTRVQGKGFRVQGILFVVDGGAGGHQGSAHQAQTVVAEKSSVLSDGGTMPFAVLQGFVRALPTTRLSRRCSGMSHVESEGSWF